VNSIITNKRGVQVFRCCFMLFVSLSMFIVLNEWF